MLTKVWQYQLFNPSKVFFLVHYIPKPKLTFYHSSLNMQNKWTEFRSESRDERNGIKLSNRILPQVFLKRFYIFFYLTCNFAKSDFLLCARDQLPLRNHDIFLNKNKFLVVASAWYFKNLHTVNNIEMMVMTLSIFHSIFVVWSDKFVVNLDGWFWTMMMVRALLPC